MEVSHCHFPDDIFYDGDFLTWVRIRGDDEAVIGVTSPHVALVGRVTSVVTKPVGVRVERGRNLALIETAKYFGAVRSPITGGVKVVNDLLLKEPKAVNDYPYGKGWLAVLTPSMLTTEREELRAAAGSQSYIERRIKELRVRCFSAYPDHEMYEIGIECSAVLAKLNDILVKVPLGEVVHLVTDDPFSDIEMVRWSDQTGQSVLETRKEDNLFHFIVKKVRG